MRLYLDIDGVLNANVPNRIAKTFKQTTSDGFTFKMKYDPSVIERLNELNLEIVVASTWREDGVKVLRRMGVRDVTRVLHPGLDPAAETTWPSIHWKQDAIRQDVELNPGAFIHVDDENDDNWCAEIAELGGFALKVDQFFGLRADDLDRIEDARSRMLD